MAKKISGERIAKIIAAAGVCSRRDAEKMILAGRVKVDGVVITSPALNITAQTITIDDAPLNATTPPRLFRYYKPLGLVTTHKDEQGRKTVFESLPADMPRVVSIGRLDLNSEGLLLLTTSGELARKFELPSSNYERVYRVRIYGRADLKPLQTLKDGIEIDGMRYSGIKVEVEKQGATNAWLRMTLHEGKNREIRRVLAAFGLEVNRLIRIKYGDYELGKLLPGEVAEVK